MHVAMAWEWTPATSNNEHYGIWIYYVQRGSCHFKWFCASGGWARKLGNYNRMTKEKGIIKLKSTNQGIRPNSTVKLKEFFGKTHWMNVIVGWQAESHPWTPHQGNKQCDEDDQNIN